jgi:hypothetical protein
MNQEELWRGLEWVTPLGRRRIGPYVTVETWALKCIRYGT